MKTHARLISLTALLLALLGAPAANADPVELSANVPFEFTAGARTLSAGRYTVEPLSARRLILVRGHREGVFLMIGAAPPGAKGKPARLVFHRYGNRYFLRQVWFAGTSGYGLPESREERDVAARRHKLAMHPVVVTIVGSLG